MNSISLHRWARLALFVLSSLALTLAVAHGAGLRVNVTPSLPKGIYRLSQGTPEKDDLVTFCLEGEFAALARERGYLEAGSCPSGLRPLLKRLEGLPGDFVDPADFPARAIDNQGRPMPSVLLPGVIPPGMGLVLTGHPGSFDSRYFGLVPLNSLQRVEPVFLFSEPERLTKPLNGGQIPPTALWRALFRFTLHRQSSFTALNPKGE